MSLRYKTSVIIGLTLLVLLAALAFSSQTVLLRSFRDLEGKEARERLDRAQTALSWELSRLSATAGDWALWDDTWRFMEDLNREYVEANLSRAAFQNVGIDLMAFVRPSGELAYYLGYDPKSGAEERPPEELRNYLRPDARLLRLDGPEGSATGLVMLPDGALLVASRPIMPSDRQGPVRGVLVVGRRLDDEYLQALSEAAGAKPEILRPEDARVPASLVRTGTGGPAVQPRDEHSLGAFAWLKDPEGQPAAVLYLDMPRDIYAHGKAACRYLVYSLFIVGIVLGAVTLGAVLEMTVLSPVSRLRAAASAIGATGDLSARLPVSGRDELSSLARSINDLLSALQRARLDEQKALQEVRDAGELLRGVVESLPMGLCVVDPDGKVRLWNAALEAECGVSREQMLGRDLFDHFPGLGKAGLRELYARMLSTGQPIALSDLPLREPGLARPEYHLNIRANPLVDAAGRIAGAVVTVRDISERRRMSLVQEIAYQIADAANRSASVEGLAGFAREALGAVMDTRNFYIAIQDPEADRLVFPYYADETLPPPGYSSSYSRKPARGLTEYVMRTGKGLLATREDILALAESGDIEIIGELPAVWLGAPLALGDRIIGVVAVQNYSDRRAYNGDDLWLLQFVSGQLARAAERKRAEEALARSRDFYLSLFDEFPALIWRCDASGRCDYCNKSWQTFTGRSLQQEIGDGWLESVHEEDRAAFGGALHRALPAREPFELECRLRRHDGQYRWFLVVGRPYRDLDGEFAGYLASCYDVTERKRLEDQFRQSQKMEAIGRLAGGIAHDFNNLLTAITGYATFARDALPPDSPSRDDINQVLKSADRATALVRQLLVFSRRQPSTPVLTNLNEVVINLGRMLRPLISEDVELVTVPGSDLGTVRVDPGQIEQVLINLVVNAADAMPSGGKVTIETANVTLDADYARHHVDVNPGEYVMLAVSDTGCGMTDEVKAHIFEPFFTTKEPGKGTGLGLATSYGIVKQNGGHIWFYSEPGKGTTFKIYFPRVAGGPPKAEDPADVLELLGTQTVLLVEDDAAVRAFAARGLRDAGYRVLEAANGPQALGVVARHRGPVDLLVTDLVMPKMGGEELARRLRASYPHLKTLFISGYTESAAGDVTALGADAAFVEKPFTLVTLVSRVRDLLAN